MRPAPGEVLHVSEDPSIERFTPHVAPTARSAQPFVWAVTAEGAPSYWFPRQCPRGMCWDVPGRTTEADRELLVGVDRVHAIEPPWLEALRTTQLWGYRFASTDFRPLDPDEPDVAWVADREVVPLGPPEPFDPLLGLHAAAGIELRVVPDLAAWWARMWPRSFGFSGIRLGNAGRGPDELAGSLS